MSRANAIQGTPALKYRAEIDGLRALAVVPVILFHAGFEWFSGGFVGVDVFFVISGYLITTILVDDIEKRRFSIVSFYERRARRIFPALFFMMLACIPFAWMWMLPDPMENFGQSVVATTLFANNILLMITTGYWDLASEFKPLLHTWSLGVEEQYYVVFPLLLLLGWRFGKKAMVGIIAALAVVSLAVSELGSSRFPDANFYLITSRAWELFAGSMAAFVVQKYGVRNHNGWASLGLLAIVFAILAYDSSTPFPGLYALVPVLGVVLLVLFAGEQTWVARLLSLRLMVGIGLISYSAYLWHQPLFSFARIYMVQEPGRGLFIVLTLATFMLAWLSWKFIENPFRNKSRVSARWLWGFVFIASFGLVVFGLAAHKTHGFVSRVFDQQSVAPEDMYIAYNERNFKFKQAAFISAAPVKLLIIGNSFGRDMVNAVRETYDLTAVELVYRDDLDDCSLMRSDQGKALFAEADVVLFASNYGVDDYACTPKVIGRAAGLGSQVFFVGSKQFGHNLNWVARTPPQERAWLRNPILEDVLEQERVARERIPASHYLSIIDVLMDSEHRILITDGQGRLMSADRVHLTKYGAIHVGREVLRPSALTAALAAQ